MSMRVSHGVLRITARRLNVHVGGCRRPFLGLEREKLGNGVVWRLSLWPIRFGVHVAYWWETAP